MALQIGYTTTEQQHFSTNSPFSTKMSGFNVEDLVIDLFYCFEKNTKRKASLGEYCTFCDIDYRQIIKHVNTKWLSWERAVGRLLQQYDALTCKSYFLSEGMYCYSSSLVDYSIPRFRRRHASFGMPICKPSFTSTSSYKGLTR